MRAMKSKNVIELSQVFATLELSQKTKVDLDRQIRLLNIEAIDAAKEAGLELLAIKQALAPATIDNPLETDLGWFTSFDDYLNKHGWDEKARSYVELAESWDIALELGAQDVDNPVSDMELVPLLKLIDWYNKSVEAGVEPKLLTLRRYKREQRARRA